MGSTRTPKLRNLTLRRIAADTAMHLHTTTRRDWSTWGLFHSSIVIIDEQAAGRETHVVSFRARRFTRKALNLNEIFPALVIQSSTWTCQQSILFTLPCRNSVSEWPYNLTSYAFICYIGCNFRRGPCRHPAQGKCSCDTCALNLHPRKRELNVPFIIPRLSSCTCPMMQRLESPKV